MVKFTNVNDGAVFYAVPASIQYDVLKADPEYVSDEVEEEKVDEGTGEEMVGTEGVVGEENVLTAEEEKVDEGTGEEMVGTEGVVGEENVLTAEEETTEDKKTAARAKK